MTDIVVAPGITVLEWSETALFARVDMTASDAGSRVAIEVYSVMPTDGAASVPLAVSIGSATVDIPTGTSAPTVVKLDVSPDASAIISISPAATSGAPAPSATLGMELWVRP